MAGRKSSHGGRRTGSGRKPKGLVYRTIGFPAADFKKIAALARKRGESLAVIVREAVREYLAKGRP